MRISGHAFENAAECQSKLERQRTRPRVWGLAGRLAIPGTTGRGGDAPAKPLTPEQVGLVRAWIDQVAK
jgi:hypothetical protein